ncbi:hypothetical protein BH09MYX1_BH09MYX1_47900 [soil metagenome]
MSDFEPSPDDTAPQSAVDLLDLELSDALPPDPPSMAPPAWTIDFDDDELSDPAVPTPWRPRRGALITTTVFVQVCLFVLLAAGARTAYAHFDDSTTAVAKATTHRKTAAVELNFASRIAAHNKKWHGFQPTKK